MMSRNIIFLLMAIFFSCAVAQAGSLSTPYTEPSQFTRIPFGQHSYWAQPHTAYPAVDAPLTSPAPAAIGRIASRMRAHLDPSLTKTRPLRLSALNDTHDHVQFQGDGTPAHPNLYDRDVFAFLPYQVNARRFVIPYQVMTRDVMQDLLSAHDPGARGRGHEITCSA